MKLRLWPGMVFALLGLNMSIVGTTVWLAGRDRSFAIEPDYDSKAVRWDQVVKQRQVNDALGWHIDFQVDPVIDAHAVTMSIRARITDAVGKSLQPTQVRVDAFPSIRASARQSTALTIAPDGTCAGSLGLTAPGTWRFDLTVVIGGDTCTARYDRLITAPLASTSSGGGG